MSVARPLMVEVQGLCKSYRSRQRGGRRVRAVDGLDIHVHSGETFGLLGADGAGKTTTLRLLNGLLRADRGVMRVAGLDPVSQYRQIHRLAGYMPQQFALYGDMSVRENLEFFAEAYGLTRREKAQRIPRLLHFARLSEFQERLAAQLSGGMKKKLALACMLVHDPQIVFLDEPTLGVDPVSRREFWNLLSELRAEKGLTILVCTPYMDEAERCHRVGLLHAGRLIACDTPQAIKRMVGGELLEVHAADVYRVREVLQNAAGVLEIQPYGDVLHVLVDDAARREGEMRTALAAQGVALGDVRLVEARMEEAFVALIRRQRSQAGDIAGCTAMAAPDQEAGA